jgi:hypothetical protein
MSITATFGPKNLAYSAKTDDTPTMTVMGTVTAERGDGCVPGMDNTIVGSMKVEEKKANGVDNGACLHNSPGHFNGSWMYR